MKSHHKQIMIVPQVLYAITIYSFQAGKKKKKSTKLNCMRINLASAYFRIRDTYVAAEKF